MFRASALKYTSYRWYWLASLLSIGSYQLGILVRALLGYEISEGNSFLAALVVAGAVPGILLFSLYGGSLGDRFNKRTLTQVCQVISGALTASIGVIFFLGWLSLPLLLGILLVQGVFYAVQAPVRQSLIADLVPDKELESTFSLNGLSIGLVNLVSAAGGRLAYDAFGAGWAFVIASALLFGDVALLSLLPKTAGQVGAKQRTSSSAVRDIALGLRQIWRVRRLRLVVLHAIGVLLLFMPARLLLPVFALEVHGSSAVEVGWLIIAIGIGGVVGSLWLARRRKGASVWVAVGADLAIGTAMVLLGLSGSFYFAMGSAVLWGLGIAIFVPLQQALIARQAGEKYRARSMGVFFLAYGFVRLGLLPLGAIFENGGAAWSILALGICVTLAGLAVIAVFTRLQKISAEPA